MFSGHHLIFQPHTSVKCANGIALHSFAGMVRSYLFKTFACWSQFADSRAHQLLTYETQIIMGQGPTHFIWVNSNYYSFSSKTSGYMLDNYAKKKKKKKNKQILSSLPFSCDHLKFAFPCERIKSFLNLAQKVCGC